VRQHSQSETFERAAHSLQQQPVLKRPSRKGHHVLQPSILPLENVTDHLNNCEHKSAMEPCRHNACLGMVL
jgi:hypothetical protein